MTITFVSTPAPPARGRALAEPAACRAAFRRMAAAVTVVTSMREARPCGVTASAVCSLSLEPPLVLICLANRSRTLETIRQCGRFAINVLAREQEQLSRAFAAACDPAERFDAVPFRVVHRLPVLERSLAWLVCDVAEALAIGDHTVVIGSICDARADDGEPLIWHAGGYRSVA